MNRKTGYVFARQGFSKPVSREHSGDAAGGREMALGVPPGVGYQVVRRAP